MLAWGKWVIAAVAPLLLTACLWGPGKFTSDLSVRRNGTFVLDYRGEILLQLPKDEAAGEPWSDDKARCMAGRDGSTPPPPIIATPGVPPKERPCTRAEIARQKAEHQKRATERAEAKRKEAEQMAKLLGLPGADDASNRRFAANLMKYKGWRSVRYQGESVFDVDYHFEGRLDQDFVFPLMPDSDFLIPFVAIRRRSDGAVLVTAPALTGGSGPFGARAKAMGLPNPSDGPRSRAAGRFTIITDGEILTNNSEDGPIAHPAGKQVRWEVGPGSTKVPEMLVRL